MTQYAICVCVCDDKWHMTARLIYISLCQTDHVTDGWMYEIDYYMIYLFNILHTDEKCKLWRNNETFAYKSY